uniref:Uncharacterized protein n=1 Tax=Ditylenchus dipsaci TaxID=166011 RepID=A0A915DZ03_9BILA
MIMCIVFYLQAAHLEVGESNVYGTCIFKRANLDLCRPSAILVSKNPTFAVKCSPVCYELREDVKENFLGLPYRAVFAPFSYIDNVFCGDMTSLAWTPDGKVLVVSSLEGFNCFITIDTTELEGEREAKTEIIYPDSPKIAPVRKTPRSRKDPLSQVKKEATPTKPMETEAAAVQSNKESNGGTPNQKKKEGSKLTPTHSKKESKARLQLTLKRTKKCLRKNNSESSNVVQRRINQFW